MDRDYLTTLAALGEARPEGTNTACVAWHGKSHTGWVGLDWVGACALPFVAFVFTCRRQVANPRWLAGWLSLALSRQLEPSRSDLTARSARLIQVLKTEKTGWFSRSLPTPPRLLSLLLLLVSLSCLVAAKVSCFIRLVAVLVSFLPPSVHIVHTARFPPRC